MPSTPRWVADDMLGRLARFLRVLGYDTDYATGRSDDELAQLARHEHRTLLTRDRPLGRRVAGSITIASDQLGTQLLEVRRVVPTLQGELSFERCTRCNGQLSRVGPEALDPSASLGFTPPRPWYRCDRCAHLYWEGTHTQRMRVFLRATFSP